MLIKAYAWTWKQASLGGILSIAKTPLTLTQYGPHNVDGLSQIPR